MNSFVRRLGQRLPRRWRNHLKSPVRAVRWWWLARQPDRKYQPKGAECSFLCPPLAVEHAFRLQFADPEQAAEFTEFRELIRPLRTPLFFDLGCHFGLFSHVLLARSKSSGRVLAVDPSGTACAMVRHIAAANGWTDRLEVLQAAVGGRTGELEMVDGGVMLAGYFMAASDQPPGDRIRVPQFTIDDLTQRAGRKPDLIKIDIESFELEALDGAHATLSGGQIPLCLEIHNRYLRERNADPRQVLAKVTALGYRHWTCAGQPITAEAILARDLVRIVARP